ncbi:MAG TPA: ABC transporter ATP-binding protein [Vicinamibacterales bacterium]|nr:ABC transporter ATP-binding protein [Vicinamibacterales bacterium]
MLVLTSVSKRYEGRGGLSILENVDLQVDRGQSVAIMGPSGSGKSTLLYLIGALDPPSAGTVTIDDVNPYQLNEKAQAEFRSAKIGFIFQDHLLLPQLSALDNVLVPTVVGKSAPGNVRQRAKQLLDEVGLGARLDHRPAELSGGERQRVAIARALIMAPALVLCDEPTGNLDRASADAVAGLLGAIHARHQSMLVVVTHSPALAARFERRYDLVDRRLQAVA